MTEWSLKGNWLAYINTSLQFNHFLDLSVNIQHNCHPVEWAQSISISSFLVLFHITYYPLLISLLNPLLYILITYLSCCIYHRSSYLWPWSWPVVESAEDHILRWWPSQMRTRRCSIYRSWRSLLRWNRWARSKACSSNLRKNQSRRCTRLHRQIHSLLLSRLWHAYLCGGYMWLQETNEQR